MKRRLFPFFSDLDTPFYPCVLVTAVCYLLTPSCSLAGFLWRAGWMPPSSPSIEMCAMGCFPLDRVFFSFFGFPSRSGAFFASGFLELPPHSRSRTPIRAPPLCEYFAAYRWQAAFLFYVHEGPSRLLWVSSFGITLSVMYSFRLLLLLFVTFPSFQAGGDLSS